MKKNYIIIGVVAVIAIIIGAIAIKSGGKNNDDNKVINDITVSVNLDGENVGTGTIENNEVVINGSLIGLEDRNYTLAEIDESGFSVGQSNVGTDVVVNIKTDSITDQTDESNVVNNGDDSNIGVNVNDKQNENNGEDSTFTNDGNDKNSENVDSNVGTETGDETDENGKSTTTEPTKPTETDTKTEQPIKNDGKQGGTGDAKSETKPEGNTGNTGNSSNSGNTGKTETPSETKPETKPETPAKSEDKKDEGNKGTTTEPTKPAEPIKPAEPTKPTEPEKPSKPSNNTTNLLPEKVGTTDFDADNNSDFEKDDGSMVANLEYSKGMIISSSKVSRSSNGVEAIKEYIDDMTSAFTSFDTKWTSDSYVKLAKQSVHLSIDSSGRYNVYMKNVNKNTAGTNLWLNFIAYVTNKDVAKAVYGICVEKITLGDFAHMSSELVAKYGGTLVNDIEVSQTTRMASVSINGYSLNIKYTSCLDESSITNGAVLSDLIAQYTVII